MILLCKIFGIWCSVLSGMATVTDGDTLRIDGKAIRLQGIDAPEMTERYGGDSRVALLRFTLAQTVKCADTGERSYNRIVAVCRVNGVDLAELMVKSGHALDCAKFSKGRYRQFEPKDIRLQLFQKPYC